MRAVEVHGAGGLFKVRIPDGLAGGKLENRFGIGEAGERPRKEGGVGERLNDERMPFCLAKDHVKGMVVSPSPGKRVQWNMKGNTRHTPTVVNDDNCNQAVPLRAPRYVSHPMLTGFFSSGNRSSCAE